jgi:WD40 repeat protein
VRAPEHSFRTLAGHRQEVCGLRWNVADGQLASGGNDNKLLVWKGFDGGEPLWKFEEHSAAVKAIAWSPHQRGILASGGGTADRRIRFWNTLTGTQLSSIDTGSQVRPAMASWSSPRPTLLTVLSRIQVCNLMWSKTSNEIVSTHGFSNGAISNSVCIWKYPAMTQVASLSGHTYRVLYLAMSPDGQTICTGAGDETLRCGLRSRCLHAQPTLANRSNPSHRPLSAAASGTPLRKQKRRSSPRCRPSTRSSPKSASLAPSPLSPFLLYYPPVSLCSYHYCLPAVC